MNVRTKLIIPSVLIGGLIGGAGYGIGLSRNPLPKCERQVIMGVGKADTECVNVDDLYPPHAFITKTVDGGPILVVERVPEGCETALDGVREAWLKMPPLTKNEQLTFVKRQFGILEWKCLRRVSD